MGRVFNPRELPKLLLVLGILVLSEICACQDASTLLLRLQRSRATLNIDANAGHGQGMWGLTYGNLGDVWHYPNSLSCLVVYGDGKYILEKREESTVGKPKVKLAQGNLGADDLQRLKIILHEEALKKIRTPKMPHLPRDAQAVRGIESLDTQINHAGITHPHTTITHRRINPASISA